MVYQIAVNKKCDKNKEVIIRYIPKTIEEEAKYGQTESEIFRTMFSQPSPWVKLLANYDRDKNEEIKNYFISQA
uniref:Uncharacterized protein n=1 Tax=viral metagenome TaxID=1070528 RepID=A0A6C0ACJ8_9ZZZZ